MTHEPGDTITVDAQDLVDELKAERERVAAEAERVYDEDFSILDSEFIDLDDDERLDDVTDDEFYDALRDLWKAKGNDIEQLETKIHRWGSSKFTLKYLTPGDVARRKDWTAAKAISEDQDDPRTQTEAFRLMTVTLGVVQSPGDATPSKEDGFSYVAENYTDELVRWLYDQITNLHQYGEVDPSDFSGFPPRRGGASEPNS